MIGGVLGLGRGLAESRMTEMVTVGRVELVPVPGTLDTVPTLVESYYAGIARVKFPSASAQVKVPAGQQIAETSIVVSLPASAALVPTGSMVRVDDSASDPALVGRWFRIDGQAQSGQTTAHRYPVVEES